MILVFASGLALGAWVQASRMRPVDWDRMREGSIIFVPFLITVALKLGLVVSVRARRSDPDQSTGSIARDEPLP